MIFEIGGQAYYLGDNYFAPAWWDNWVKKDIKKKVTTFHRRFK